MPQQGHPKGLYVLFFTELWERFSYYGMRALLVLYLASETINGGFGLDRTDALEIYAIFTGLVYMTPIIGGILSDKILGQRKAVFIGGVLMALGQAAMALSEGGQDNWLNLGLGLLIVGNGFFKPNISTVVGRLYSNDDPRKDGGFTIFYMGINIGATLAPLVCGYLGQKIGWSYGFGAASVGMIIGTVWFYLQSHHLGFVGFPPSASQEQYPNNRLGIKDWKDIVIYTVASALLVKGLLVGWGLISENMQNVISIAAAIAGVCYLTYTIITGTKGKTEWSRVSVIIILCVFNIFFWAGFEQAGGTFNLFAADNTDLHMAGFAFPASWFQSVNALAIVAFAPLFSMLWLALSKIGKNPNIPVKFALGLILLGLGFVVMSMASAAASDGTLVSPMWLTTVFMIHTCGELCLSPIGLSMISKLSPPKITSVMMGLWFGSTALANYMAGMMESILEHVMPDMPLFKFLVITSCSAGVVLLLISPILKKMMKGIE